MKLSLKLLLSMILLAFSNQALAELPPPGTARKGKITVDPYNTGTISEYDLKNQVVLDRAARKKAQAKIQRELDALRSRVAELEQENRRLSENARRDQRRNPESVNQRTASGATSREITSPRKNIVSLLGGIGPSHLSDRRETGGNEVALRTGPVVGVSYQRFVSESVLLGAQVQVPTYKDRSGGDGFKKDKDRYTGLASIGFAW